MKGGVPAERGAVVRPQSDGDSSAVRPPVKRVFPGSEMREMMNAAFERERVRSDELKMETLAKLAAAREAAAKVPSADPLFLKTQTAEIIAEYKKKSVRLNSHMAKHQF